MEVAEAVWLAARIIEVEGGNAGKSGVDASAAAEDLPAASASTGDEAEWRGDTESESDAHAGIWPQGQDSPPSPGPPDHALLYTPQSPDSPVRQSAATAEVVRSPVTAALPGGLDLLRALRPLKRTVPSARQLLLDEVATADRIADEGLVLPLLKPAPERWLSLVLVVDVGPSMAVWRPLVDELRELLGRLGAFRDVRVWYLRKAQDGTLGVTPRATTGSMHSPRELVDPSGRQAMLVVSDCVDDIWWSGEAGRTLALWGRSGPVAILQPLPQRLWNRTGVTPVPVRLYSSTPGVPNTLLTAVPADGVTGTDQRDSMPVPLLEIQPEWLGSWAKLISGAAEGGVDGVVAAAAPTVRDSTHGAVGRGSFPEHAADLVVAFRSAASPEAFRLAGYLAAAPLTLPTMRLVQRVMLPASRPAHLAEVFVSGLMRQAGGHEALGHIPYDFLPGVRDVLLGSIRLSETARVHDEVSAYIAERAGQSRDTTSLMASLTGSGDQLLDTTREPFAQVPAEVAQRLGGSASSRDATDGDEHEPSSLEATLSESGPSRSSRPTGPATGGPCTVATVGRIHQPVLFVGLGGTGIRIGADLERGLRSGVCGPDGRNLITDGRRLPFQLPNCLQFVYADISESELDLPRQAYQGPDPAAFDATSRILHPLSPAGYDSSPEVTRMLRVAMHEETRAWLPPQDRQPKVAPLHLGAGQLPTVARAALFATLRSGLGPVMRQLSEAISAIGRSQSDLLEVGGGRIRGCDVFVAFSVAGGTGAGIFYDVIHLISHEFRRLRFPGVRIHPLVVMPSAFPPGAGGGREAELNAAGAVIDLARLIDQQNARQVGNADFGSAAEDGLLGVRYPGEGFVTLPPRRCRPLCCSAGVPAWHQMIYAARSLRR
ncbi:hypothetical protein GLX30_05995 [Streptomyces sp. Tu 2975]|uniref:tubulin-like doman-containing protein n=1 Tax=Streptomyces sp. Tu 2975 TaxID=2676871 RepID=UPI00135B11CC|nr:tubulin-like doman-containing protein [Streptomyces sp. Tu 2975]QIP83689.1 hypothetical protein GLX30_05995 [Streptomyces sp. Tu 2975]